MDPTKPPVDDAPSAAEVEFIERVRNARAQGRRLRRRAMLVATTMLVVLAALLATRGVPRARLAPGAGPGVESRQQQAGELERIRPRREPVRRAVATLPPRDEGRTTRVAKKVSRRHMVVRETRIDPSRGRVWLGSVTEAP